MIKSVVFTLTGLLLIFGSEAVGYAFFRLLGITAIYRSPLLAIAFGLALLTAVLIACGLLGIYTPLILLMIWGLWLLAACVRLLFFFPTWLRECRGWLNDARMLPVICRVSLLVLFVVMMASVMTPETRHDPYDYHLSVPNLYLAFGEIAQIPWHVFSYMPKNGEILFGLALAVDGDMTAKLIHFLFTCLSIGLIMSAVANWTHHENGLLAGTIAATLPVLGFVSTASYVDSIRMFWELMALWTLYRAYEEGDTYTQKAWFTLSALFAGMAMGSKYVAWLVFGAPYALLYVWVLWQKWPRRKYEAAMLSAIALSLPLLPWLILNYQWTGNPVYPLLPGLFGFHIPPAQEAYEFFKGHAPSHEMFSLTALPSFIWMRISRLLLDGNALLFIGAAACAVSLWWRRMPIAQTLPKPAFVGLNVYLGLSSLLFLFGTDNHDGRFFLATLVLFAVPVTYFFYSLRDWLELHSEGAHYLLPGLILILFFNALSYRFAQLQDLDESMVPIVREETQEEWLSRKFTSYPVIVWANENLPSSAFVLGMGYPLRRKNIAGNKFGYIPALHQLPKDPQPAQLAEALHNMGITHVAKPYPKLGEPIDLSLLEARYFTVVYEYRSNILYRFHASGAPIESP